ncbi:tRNA (adenosine(37)-N6)-threonylcarbamoyltransferase complex ATPase subunit type 1 TsaE [Tabrizicola oligotrophica]|uniref:tRNA threonylcarbamoyladenosine biosynthesis protein TsaE n=1 Tax=Tabrizicola oligotrophica TaxID=2710650 RepID=A0A6M0QSC1_9RHOB|nr:tRNA (adenosine(37)-N6)-threonylcarbamoyltransferase complex ATPase subunit type 1 TsaE [Tabrizicola oligotrophica]NEY90326.1 tRNA (adenosine(37)-N6)-threonylcarbamoyltransferase complex ATPase subunit type 1 TsaE [Tabrizicola oligotrophica]
MVADASPFSLFLADADETDRLGRWFAPRLGPGDCLLLEGPIGSGKSQFARALIQARLGRAEDVPSPTFTLVQTYHADVEIWHADLYRLSHPDEVLELGLDAAFDTAICLIEWPDRLGSHAPPQALRLCFQAEGDGRRVVIGFGKRADLRAALAKELADG